MKRKVQLFEALERLDASIPAEFEEKMLDMLDDFKKQKEEPIVKKKVSAALVVGVALLVLLMGVALALTQFGVWDFLKDYGETPLPEAAGMVQTDFAEKAFALGEASVTLQEAVSDGFIGSIVVEYRVPEGMYLYAPDSMTPGDPPIYGEAMTHEEAFVKHGPFYHSMDEGIGVMVNGTIEPLSAEYAITQIKTADNVMVVNISFGLQGIDPDTLVYSPGLFKLNGPDFEKREWLVVDIPLKLVLNKEKSERVTPAVSNEAQALGIEAITVTRTPLATVVKVAFDEKVKEKSYFFQVHTAPGIEMQTGFLSSFASTALGEGTGEATRGYAPTEKLPDILYVQLMQFDSKGEEVRIGEPVAITLR